MARYLLRFLELLAQGGLNALDSVDASRPIQPGELLTFCPWDADQPAVTVTCLGTFGPTDALGGEPGVVIEYKSGAIGVERRSCVKRAQAR